MNLKRSVLKLFPVLLVAVLLLPAGGCFLWRHHKKAAVVTRPANSGPIVTPSAVGTAHVIAVNDVGRFVVLGFPGGQVPKTETPLFLYRNGLKVAELRVTGPQSENNTVADIVSGEARVSDTVREQ
jgi:hypothetical protein